MKILLTIIFGLAAVSAHAGTRQGALFLNDAVPADVLAMNGAATAVTYSASALFGNPAGAALSSASRELVVTHSIGLVDSRMDSLAYTQRLHGSDDTSMFGATPNGLVSQKQSHGYPLVLGASAIYYSYGTFQAYDESNNGAGSFSASDSALAFSVARRLNSRFAAGATFRGIQQQLGPQAKASGVSGDLGLIAQTGVRGLSASAAVTNMGSGLKYSGQSYALPTLGRMGLGYQVSMLTVAVDMGVPVNGGQRQFGVAFQVLPVQTLALRMGYVGQLGHQNNGVKLSEGNQFSNFAGLGAGIGLHLGERFTLDYTLMPHQALNETQRFTLSSRF